MPAPNWWDAAPVVNDPGFSGYIPGTPKPKEPKAPVFVPKDASRMFDPNTGTFTSVPKDPNADTEGKDQLKEAIAGLGLDELLSNIDRARTNLRSPWASGTMGAIAELKPGGGTPRDNFIGNLTAVKGGVITEKLQSLKEASKTGASGFGSLSEKEGALLASSLAALTENMSPQEYEKSFQAIARHALTLQAVRDGKDPSKPDIQKSINDQALALSRLEEPPSPGGNGGPPPPGMSELNDDQKRAYMAFIKANPKPTGPQLQTFLETLTGVPGGKITNAEDIARAIRGGAGISTQLNRTDLEYQAHQKAAQMRADSAKGIGGDQGAAAVGGYGQGALAGFLDEAGAGVTALGESLGGKGSIGERYDVNLAANDEYLHGLQNRNPWTYGAGEVGGALTSFAVGGGVARGSGIAKAGVDRLGRVGANVAGNAAYGATYGAGSDNENRLRGAVTGGVGGAAGGALGEFVVAPVAQKAVDRIRLAGGKGLAPEVAQAAQAEGVDLTRPMVDPKAISQYGALESNVYSQPIIRGASGRIRGQIEDRATALGGDGTPLNTDAAGDVIQTAGNRFIQRSRDIKNRLYDRAEKLGGNSQVKTQDALGQIDTELAQLHEAPQTNAGEISFLEGLKSDLTQPQTVGSIRRIRTSLRGQINAANLTNTTAEARALRVLDAAKNDIQRDAPADAASAYARADAFNRERQTHVDTVLKQFLGKRDAPLDSEKAFARLKTLASPGGGGRNLAAMMRNLEPDERQDIAATIAHSLGRDAPDAPFSTAKFLSQTSKLSPSARRTIFGPDGAQSIDNLRLLSRALEGSEKDINRSRSATVLERQGWRNVARSVIGGLAGLGGTAATGSMAGGAAGLGVAAAAMGASATRRVLSARAMVNPRVSMWLARTATVSSKAEAKEATRRLGVIIGREPAVAAELTPIYDFLQQRLTQPLAAQPQPEGGDNAQ